MKALPSSSQIMSTTKLLNANIPLGSNDTNQLLTNSQISHLLNNFSQSFADSVRPFAYCAPDNAEIKHIKIVDNKHILVIGKPGSGKTYFIRQLFSEALSQSDSVPIMVRLDPISIRSNQSHKDTSLDTLTLLLREICYGLLSAFCSDSLHTSHLSTKQSRKQILKLVTLCDAYAHRSTISWRDILQESLKAQNDRLYSDNASQAHSFQQAWFDAHCNKDLIKQLLNIRRKGPPQHTVNATIWNDIQILLAELKAKKLLILVDGLELSVNRKLSERALISNTLIDHINRIVRPPSNTQVQLVITMQQESFIELDRRKTRYFQKIFIDKSWTSELLRKLFDNLARPIISTSLSSKKFLDYLDAHDFDVRIFTGRNPRKMMMYVSEHLEHYLLYRSSEDTQIAVESHDQNVHTSKIPYLPSRLSDHPTRIAITGQQM